MKALDYMPFTYSRSSDNNGGYKVDVKAIVQALIIAVATGLLVMYGTQQTIKVQLDSMSRNISEIKRNQAEFRKDFYLPRR